MPVGMDAVLLGGVEIHGWIFDNLWVIMPGTFAIVW